MTPRHPEHRKMRLARVAELRRATERARTTLVYGDKLRVTRCGGTVVTVTFTRFDPFFSDWICSKTRDDIHAIHIVKRNGEPISFADPPGFVAPRVTLRQHFQSWLWQRRLAWAHFRALHLPVIWVGPRFSRFDVQCEHPDGRELRINWHGHDIVISWHFSADDEVPF